MALSGHWTMSELRLLSGVKRTSRCNDCDRRLVGEGLNKSDLIISKGPDLKVVNHHNA